MANWNNWCSVSNFWDQGTETKNPAHCEINILLFLKCNEHLFSHTFLWSQHFLTLWLKKIFVFVCFLKLTIHQELVFDLMTGSSQVNFIIVTGALLLGVAKSINIKVQFTTWKRQVWPIISVCCTNDVMSHWSCWIQSNLRLPYTFRSAIFFKFWFLG